MFNFLHTKKLKIIIIIKVVVISRSHNSYNTSHKQQNKTSSLAITLQLDDVYENC